MLFYELKIKIRHNMVMLHGLSEPRINRLCGVRKNHYYCFCRVKVMMLVYIGQFIMATDIDVASRAQDRDLAQYGSVTRRSYVEFGQPCNPKLRNTG